MEKYKKITIRMLILLSLVFIIGEIIYLGLSLKYVNFYAGLQEFVSALKQASFAFAYMFFVIALPLFSGKYIYIKNIYNRLMVNK